MAFDIAGLQAGLVRAQKAFQASGAAGLQAAGEHILAESKQLVPVDTGELAASGQVQIDGDTVTISYGTDHAVFVHEITGNEHPDGQAHFLSDPLIGERDRAALIVADRMSQTT